MEPHDKPIILSILSQIEEMLIARVSPILQVKHARGGQYKYSGHTISPPPNRLCRLKDAFHAPF